MGKRVAVVLAGCGVFDGSEIHEASAVLVHLSRGGASVSVLLVDINLWVVWGCADECAVSGGLGGDYKTNSIKCVFLFLLSGMS